jgi:hypothetical protein
MKLALKHAPPKGVFKRLFHWLTAVRLLTRYPHGGIVIGDQLLHCNLSKGLHHETFLPEGWDLFDVPGGDDALAWDLFHELEHTPYDVFGLLAFVLPWRVSDSSRMYCYRWQLRVLCLIYGIEHVGRERVVPEDLLALIAQKARSE